MSCVTVLFGETVGVSLRLLFVGRNDDVLVPVDGTAVIDGATVVDGAADGETAVKSTGWSISDTPKPDARLGGEDGESDGSTRSIIADSLKRGSSMSDGVLGSTVVELSTVDT